MLLQLCLPNDDNLGDVLGHLTLNEAVAELGPGFEIEKWDLMPLLQPGEFLDDRIDEINSNYRAVVIGAGGLLGHFLVTSIFEKAESWGRIEIPLVFWGCGIIENYLPPNVAGANRYLYGLIGDNGDASGLDQQARALNEKYMSAVRHASLVSVRDYKTYFLMQRLRHGASGIFLTGCPTLFCQKPPDEASAAKRYRLGLNIPLSHGVLIQHYQKALIQVITAIIGSIDDVVLICHSDAEERDYQSIVRQLGKEVDVVYPKTFTEVAAIYSRCEATLVTKLHAALFSFANNVPFASIAYDIKCMSQLDMIYDAPNQFVLHIDELQFYDVNAKLQAMVNNLLRESTMIKASQKRLLSSMREQYDAFFKSFLALLD